MADLEPGVTLSASTIAAMERLSTPSRTAMTNQHRATPDDWAQQEDWANRSAFSDSSCIIELRSRIEALEAAQQPHQDKLDRLIALDADDGDPIMMPGYPAGSLVETVARLIANFASTGLPGDDATPTAQAAILEVAEWLRSEYPRREGYGTAWANLIEREANR